MMTMYFLVSLLLAVACQSVCGSPISFPDGMKMDNNKKSVVLLPGSSSSHPVSKALESKPVPAMLGRLGNTKDRNTLRLPSGGVHNGGNTTGEISGNIQSSDASVISLVYGEISGQGGWDHIGNKQSNETSLQSLGDDSSNTDIDGKDSVIPSMGIENDTESDYYYYYYYEDDNYYANTEIPNANEPLEKSVNEPMEKSVSEPMRKSMNEPMGKSMTKRMGKSLTFNSGSTSHLPSDGATGVIFFGDEIRRPANTMLMFPTTPSPVYPNPSAAAGNIQNSPAATGNIQNSPAFNPCGRDGDILYQGECHQVLSSGPCGTDKWLVLKDFNTAQCEPRPCPMGQIFYQNRCVYPEDSTICATGQMLYVELTGIAFCDCDSDYIYFPQEGTCIPEYEQGWCPWGKYLVRNNEGTPECASNPCGISGSVYHKKNRMCYRKKYVGHCREEDIEINGNNAECQEMLLAVRNIFEVPTLRRCPRGSKRDILHECRRRFNMPSMPSVLKAKHLYGGCPHGWTKAPGGRCKKIVNLFAGRR